MDTHLVSFLFISSFSHKNAQNPLRDYVVRTFIDLLGNRSGWLLENLNGMLSAHWDIILKTTNLSVVSASSSNAL